MSWFQHGPVKLYYEDTGNSSPVLLLPGFAGRIEELAPIQNALLNAGFRVIAADLPGSGRSQPQPRAYTASYYEEDANSFAALLQYIGVGAAHLVGFSDGGEIALLMAALTPEMVASVAVWGAVGVINDPDGSLRASMFNVVDDPIPPLKPFRDYLLAAYGEANARVMTQSVVTALGVLIEQGGDISLSKAGAIACPVLLIAGEQDFFAPPALADQLADRIRTAQVVTVNGAGHDVHHARPDWLADRLTDWLKRIAV